MELTHITQGVKLINDLQTSLQEFCYKRGFKKVSACAHITPVIIEIGLGWWDKSFFLMW